MKRNQVREESACVLHAQLVDEKLRETQTRAESSQLPAGPSLASCFSPPLPDNDRGWLRRRRKTERRLVRHRENRQETFPLTEMLQPGSRNCSASARNRFARAEFHGMSQPVEDCYDRLPRFWKKRVVVTGDEKRNPQLSMYRNRAPLALFLLCKADGPKGHPARMVGPLRCVESISVFRLIQVNTLVPGRIMSYQDLMRSTVLPWRDRACGFRTDRRGPLGGDVGDVGSDVSCATASRSARGRTNRGNGIGRNDTCGSCACVRGGGIRYSAGCHHSAEAAPSSVVLKIKRFG